MSVEIEQTLECLTHENTFGQDALVRRWIVTIMQPCGLSKSCVLINGLHAHNC